MLSQIHINVTEEFWEALYGGTSLWKDRSAASICRYALHELFVEKCVLKTPGIRLPRRGPVKGPRHLQVKATSADEDARWNELATRYGSRAMSLAIALQFLHDSLTLEEEPEPKKRAQVKPEKLVSDGLGVTSAEVARLRKHRAVSP